MDRTLYLNENKGLEVTRDGPSVWIKEDGKAGRRIPVRLVGRVVVIGNLKIEAGVITLFTENDIPVTFMNRKGREVAVTIPYNHNLPRHYEEQRVLLDTEENENKVKTWISSKRRDFHLSTVKRLSPVVAADFMSKGFRESDYRDFIKKLRPRSEEQWIVICGLIGNLFKEIIIGSLMKCDLDPHMGILHRRHNFGLALDVCHIMGPEIDLHSIQFFRRNRDNNLMQKGNNGWIISQEGMRDIIHRFENRRKALHEKIENMIDDIFRIMRELRIEERSG